jgi:intracellular sulfur oxidation DsrE/DsrF family protein
MKNRRFNTLFVLLLAGLFLLISAGPGIAVDDREALQGMTAAKVVFDVKKDDPQQLLRALTAIRKTHERLIRQDVQPDFVVTLRGPTAVSLIDMNEDPDADEYQAEVLDKVSWNIIALQKAGVQLEICSLDLSLVGMADAELLPGIKKVGNSLVSLIAYQNKGYAMVAI